MVAMEIEPAQSRHFDKSCFSYKEFVMWRSDQGGEGERRAAALQPVRAGQKGELVPVGYTTPFAASIFILFCFKSKFWLLKLSRYLKCL